MERTTMTMTDAVIERPLALIEKLRKFRDEYRRCIHPDNCSDRGADLIDDCVVIAMKHSDWVSFDNEKPKNLQRILVCFKEKGIISGTWFADKKNPNDGFFSSDNAISDFYHLSDNTLDLWQPIKPPSEVQT